jgi:hypothetical protein
LAAPAEGAVKERPILFSSPMVRAILAGTKTQTRRVIPDAPDGATSAGVIESSTADNGLWSWLSGDPKDADTWVAVGENWRCPYGIPGDRLWVRETWKENIPPSGWIYRATDAAGLDPRDERPWRPSIFMPRAASRITLEVTEVRVLRLQEISEPDALAEGFVRGHATGRVALEHGGFHIGPVWPNARAAYEECWDDLNLKRGYGWATNPWVWAITFRRVQADPFRATRQLERMLPGADVTRSR